MLSLMYSIVGFLVAISLLVAVHEFGHYFAARKLGVKVLKFSIGFGKPLISWTGGPDKTEYRVAMIPLGGFVQMLGENEPGIALSETDRARSFDAQPIWKRSVIAAAGPLINFLFAILLFIVLGASAERQYANVFGEVPSDSVLAEFSVQPDDVLRAVDGKSAEYMTQHNLYIFNQVLKGEPIIFSVERAGVVRDLVISTESIPLYDINPGSMIRQLGLFPRFAPIPSELGLIVPGSPAEQAGLQVGDIVYRVNGENVATWAELTQSIMQSTAEFVSLDVERQGRSISFLVQPEVSNDAGPTRKVIGVGRVNGINSDPNLVAIERTLGEALVYGASQTWLISELTVRMLTKMVTLQVSPKNVNGPVTIADVAGQTLQIDWQAYVHFLAVISISLGIMNLLPIPMLDGGHLLTYAVEGVFGKNAADAFYAVGQRVGIVLLVGLMSLAFYNDIFRILN